MNVASQVVEHDGVRYWWRAPDGAPLASQRGDERPVDHRPHPPFFQILPCPYCGVEQDRGHDPLAHVDPRLGVPMGEQTIRSEVCGCEFRISTGERVFDCGCGHPEWGRPKNTHHLTRDRLADLIMKNTAATLTREEVAGALSVLDRIFASVDRAQTDLLPVDVPARIGRNVLEILTQGYT